MKKTWQTPQLIVLTRSTPEESVLVACKWLGGSTPQADWTDCWASGGVTCNALSES